MSLDVTLIEKRYSKCECCGKKHKMNTEEVFEANITHNLNGMAEEAGIYKHLWCPSALGITLAKDLIEPLKKGLTDMKARPEHYEKFNASNGWGLYKNFVPWIEEYLDACVEYPDAEIYISR